MGLVTRFSPSHIAQFWRDRTAILAIGPPTRTAAQRAVIKSSPHRWQIPTTAEQAGGQAVCLCIGNAGRECPQLAPLCVKRCVRRLVVAWSFGLVRVGVAWGVRVREVAYPKCRCAGVGRPRWIVESPRSALPGPHRHGWLVSTARRGRRRRVVGRSRRTVASVFQTSGLLRR